MSENMVPIEGESQKKRVVRLRPVFAQPIGVNSTTDRRLRSAIFSIQI